MTATKLQVRLQLWRRLMSELKHRGQGFRESGAFLLGDVGGSEIKHFIPYDDLDPTALLSGIVAFQGIGYVPLWNFCAEKRMTVLGDVHTHGRKWTGQSETDRTNPMVDTPGHMALIVPYFAKGNESSLKGVGIFEYLGDHQWRRWSERSGKIQIIAE